MKLRIIHAVCLGLALLVRATATNAQTPVGTAFTYQGQLQEDDGSPVSDPTCDFTFELWADEVSVDPGDLMGTEWKLAVGMTDGLFSVTLDFGVDAFAGDARWLQIEARCPAGGGAYEPLSPRQELTPAPYALWAADLQLPFSDSAVNTSGPVLQIRNNATSGIYASGGQFLSSSADGTGVRALANKYGLYGESLSTKGGCRRLRPRWLVRRMGLRCIRRESGRNDGVGVGGNARAQEGFTYGVWGGATGSDDGCGVKGEGGQVRRPGPDLRRRWLRCPR